jgi:proteasome lid subunit RPN8/RPN11
METLRIEEAIYEVMIAHVRALSSQEACGLLAGKNGRITHIYLIENSLQSPVAYTMDPQQQIEAMLHVDAQDLDLLAAYHSHPQGPATPSPTDVAQAYYPAMAHLIISLQEQTHPTVRAFFIRDGRIEEIALLVEQRARPLRV